MSARGNISRDQFGDEPVYHGTRATLPEGGYLKSALENRRVHFTTDPEQARLWATDAEGDGPVRVYQVHPEGEAGEGRGQGGYASHGPVRIGREVTPEKE